MGRRSSRSSSASASGGGAGGVSRPRNSRPAIDPGQLNMGIDPSAIGKMLKSGVKAVDEAINGPRVHDYNSNPRPLARNGNMVSQIFKKPGGGFEASIGQLNALGPMTRTGAKTFKTEAGAKRWGKKQIGLD